MLKMFAPDWIILPEELHDVVCLLDWIDFIHYMIKLIMHCSLLGMVVEMNDASCKLLLESFCCSYHHCFHELRLELDSCSFRHLEDPVPEFWNVGIAWD